MSKKTFQILSERTEQREVSDADVAQNPYWQWDEIAPHPDPSKGCIQRGLCCKSNPGRFAPGEVERAAELLDMAPDAFVRAYLVVDPVEVDDQVVYTFAPVKLTKDGKPALPPASTTDALYRVLRGQCVFYDGKGCKIYGARPTECARYVCTNAPEDNPSLADMGRLWLETSKPS